MLFIHNTGDNVVDMSQAFNDFARFEELNLFKYAFSVIQDWETDALQLIIWWCLLFVNSYGRRRWK